MSTPLAVTDFYNDLKQIDKNFKLAFDDKKEQREFLEKNWFPKIKERVQQEEEQVVAHLPHYIEAFKTFYGNHFSPLYTPGLPLPKGIEKKYIAMLKSNDPMKIQQGIDAVKANYDSNGDKNWKSLDMIMPLHPVYSMLMTIKRKIRKVYQVDFDQIYDLTFQILKYYYLHKAEVVARALCFSIGLKMSEIHEATEFAEGEDYLEIEINSAKRKFYTISPPHIVQKALSYIQTFSAVSLRKDPAFDIFEPLTVDALPSLHAYAALFLFPQHASPHDDEGSGQRDFLRSQGLPLRPTFEFEIIGTSSLEILVAGSEKKDHERLHDLEKSLNMAEKDAARPLFTQIFSNTLSQLTRDFVREGGGSKDGKGCGNAVATKVTNAFKKALIPEMPVTPPVQLKAVKLKEGAV